MFTLLFLWLIRQLSDGISNGPETEPLLLKGDASPGILRLVRVAEAIGTQKDPKK